MPHEFCEEHSGQKTLLKSLLGLSGIAVTLLIFQVGLTLKMNDSLKSELSNIRERVAVMEYRLEKLGG